MIGIQIVAVLFALWMVYFSFLHYRRKEFSKSEFVLWEIIWTGLIVIVLFPGSVRFLLDAFSITRTFDLVVIIGIMILFGVTFRNYVTVRRLERRIEATVRDQALKEGR